MTRVPEARAGADELVEEIGVSAAGGRLGVAALLYTYQCTIACRHCCFTCGTDRPRVRMETDKAVRHLRSLHELGRVIHIAGGECMIYWDDLVDVLQVSRAEGVQPHFIETNCSFASDDGIVRERLRVLERSGVKGILLSADPFHQAFVPPERFIRTRRLARETFGPENVWCTDAPDDKVREFAGIARDEGRLREYVRRKTPVLVGRAWQEIRRFVDDHAIEDIPLGTGWRRRYSTRGCAVDFERETIWEIHIDPYDNVQTNCGVVLGDASRTSPGELFERGPGEANEIARILVRDGPFGLAELAAERHGFTAPDRARTKCDLCYTVRRFLRPHYPDILAPAEVYGG